MVYYDSEVYTLNLSTGEWDYASKNTDWSKVQAGVACFGNVITIGGYGIWSLDPEKLNSYESIDKKPY